MSKKISFMHTALVKLAVGLTRDAWHQLTQSLTNRMTVSVIVNVIILAAPEKRTVHAIMYVSFVVVRRCFS